MNTNKAHEKVDGIRKALYLAHQSTIGADIETKEMESAYKKADGKLVTLKKAISKIQGHNNFDSKGFEFRRPVKPTSGRISTPTELIGELRHTKESVSKFREEVKASNWNLVDHVQRVKKSLNSSEKGIFNKLITDIDTLIKLYSKVEA